ncbi:MAG: phosphoesterase PA-phosphatase related protein [Geminicoccaceae bacterium]|nr:phosphoesterase PA-phosphatase related protein [Geminicoccaceae bacterium]
MRTLLTLTTALTVTASTVTLAQPADTTRISRDPLFTARDAWIAAAFVAGAVALHPADRYFARKLQTPNNQENRFLREAARELRFIGTPGTTIIGVSMYAVGRVAKVDKMADLGLHGTEAVLLAQQAVGLIKGIAGRGRPALSIDDERSFVLGRGFRRGGDLYRSFPSGHAALGFAAAAAVTSETSKWWPNSTWYIAPVMYGGATLIAASRMYNNKHWASDVVVGAAIGTFAGMKVVQYHHSHPGNRIDKWLLRPSVQKTPDGQVALGLALEMPLR